MGNACGDDDEEYGRGGAAGGKAPQHVDIYETHGGKHQWLDQDRGRQHGARGGGKWIKGAIKHPGALHKQLGVPQGQKIPEKKLAAASHSDNTTLRKRANLAKTLKKMHH